MKVFGISDLHLSCRKISKLRFESNEIVADWTQETENLLISNWDSTTSDNDIIFNLGDLFRRVSSVKSILKLFDDWILQRRGIHVFVKGNHDSWWTNSKIKELRANLPSDRVTFLDDKNIFVSGNVALVGCTGYPQKESKLYRGDEQKEEERNIIRKLKNQMVLISNEIENNGDLKVIVGFHFPPLCTWHKKQSKLIKVLSNSRAGKENRILCVAYGHIHKNSKKRWINGREMDPGPPLSHISRGSYNRLRFICSICCGRGCPMERMVGLPAYLRRFCFGP